MKLKNIIIILLTLIWGFIIFYASSKTSVESNNKSKELIYKATEKVAIITNKLHITNIDITNKKNITKIVNKLNLPLRKCAHATVYFILSILLIILFKNFNVKSKTSIILTILICFIYSLTDEYHQLHVLGRSGQFSDCLIDTLGSIIGIILVYSILNIKNKK